MPKQLEPGILYLSEEFGIAGHICPCGCGNKVITPLGPTDWLITIRKGKPSLYPSIGNWQLPCKSHYWIERGAIKWSYQWSEAEILQGRKREERQRELYYDNIQHKKKESFLRRIWNWLTQN